MLDREQRDKIIKLFSDGMSVSDIAREVSVSRESVCRVIQREFHALKERLRKTLLGLEGKFRELRKPPIKDDEFAAVSAVGDMESGVDGLMSFMLTLWDMQPKLRKRFGGSPHCPYCGEELKYVVRKKGGVLINEYRCNTCKKLFSIPGG